MAWWMAASCLLSLAYGQQATQSTSSVFNPYPVTDQFASNVVYGQVSNSIPYSSTSLPYSPTSLPYSSAPLSLAPLAAALPLAPLSLSSSLPLAPLPAPLPVSSLPYVPNQLPLASAPLPFYGPAQPPLAPAPLPYVTSPQIVQSVAPQSIQVASVSAPVIVSPRPVNPRSVVTTRPVARPARLQRHLHIFDNDYLYDDYDYQGYQPKYDFLASALYSQEQGCKYAPRWCGDASTLAGFYQFFPNPLLFLALLPRP